MSTVPIDSDVIFRPVAAITSVGVHDEVVGQVADA